MVINPNRSYTVHSAVRHTYIAINYELFGDWVNFRMGKKHSFEVIKTRVFESNGFEEFSLRTTFFVRFIHQVICDFGFINPA